MPRWLTAALAALAGCVLVFYMACLNYTETGRVGIMRNLVTGEVRIDHPGWNLSPPWVLVAHMETRPTRVCVESTTRGYNCRLVQFKPEYAELFVQTEGFSYYWWSNRFSFNGGYEHEYRGTDDILRGYGYSAKQYPFVGVLEEYAESE